MKILIVEDEKRLAQALSQIMKEAKYQTNIAYDGADGLELALYGSYDVIVLDVMLPKKDGFSIVKELRASKINTPVIMLTAKGDDIDKIMGLEYGADDYMTKPFNILEVKANPLYRKNCLPVSELCQGGRVRS